MVTNFEKNEFSRLVRITSYSNLHLRADYNDLRHMGQHNTFDAAEYDYQLQSELQMLLLEQETERNGGRARGTRK